MPEVLISVINCIKKYKGPPLKSIAPLSYYNVAGHLRHIVLTPPFLFLLCYGWVSVTVQRREEEHAVYIMIGEVG